MKWFDVRNNAGIGEIYLYGEITSEKWYDTDVTPSEIVEKLRTLEGAGSVKLYVNSPGGGVYAGVAIYNAIKRFKAQNMIPVTAYVDGIAASIASLIVLAADSVVMPENALFMIHNPFLMHTAGDAASLREQADRLDKVKEIILSSYVEKTGLPEDRLSEMMDVETWLNGNEAVEVGFADSVDESQKVAACFNGESAIFKDVAVDVQNFRNFPTDRLPKEEPKNDGFKKLQQRHRHAMNVLSA